MHTLDIENPDLVIYKNTIEALELQQTYIDQHTNLETH